MEQGEEKKEVGLASWCSNKGFKVICPAFLRMRGGFLNSALARTIARGRRRVLVVYGIFRGKLNLLSVSSSFEPYIIPIYFSVSSALDYGVKETISCSVNSTYFQRQQMSSLWRTKYPLSTCIFAVIIPLWSVTIHSRDPAS